MILGVLCQGFIPIELWIFLLMNLRCSNLFFVSFCYQAELGPRWPKCEPRSNLSATSRFADREEHRGNPLEVLQSGEKKFFFSEKQKLSNRKKFGGLWVPPSSDVQSQLTGCCWEVFGWRWRLIKTCAGDLCKYRQDGPHLPSR